MSGWVKLIEPVLLYGAIFAWGFWELHKLHKLRLEDERKAREEDARDGNSDANP